jgi:purine-binding chemotaxis protein CheW
MNRTGRQYEQQFVSFRISDEWYCFDIRYIREVNQNTDIMSVPLSEDYIRGLVNIRGQVVLVLDINVLMKAPLCPLTECSQIIILKTVNEIAQIPDIGALLTDCLDDKPVCFLADQIGDVLVATNGEIEPPPPHLPESKARFYSGVIQKDSILYSILTIPALLEVSSFNNMETQT